MLSGALPNPARRFQELSGACVDSERTRFALAELNSFLTALTGSDLQDAVAATPTPLTPYLASYVAAMVEYACSQHALAPPAWTREIPPLAEPVFGSSLMGLRLYLLSHSPAPFRRRNIFIDATVGPQL